MVIRSVVFMTINILRFSVDVVAGKQKAHAKKMMKNVNDDDDDVAINLMWRTG